ncbi:MAG: hypothetical protein E6R03_04015 [Hyphomicrobiaceae bacterium]|nr:MAG: hypothetical protein E6R03_04015 [Hyphomicrobiaceae bacterium]
MLPYRRLKSGRIVYDTYTDSEGNVRFYEYYDSRIGARRLAFGPYWNGKERAKTYGAAIDGMEALTELVDDQLERHQTAWHPDTRNPSLIRLGSAFPWLPPRRGDQLIDLVNQEVFTVVHVPGAPAGHLWNLHILLDAAPTVGHELSWIGEARERNLVGFNADNGHPGTPVTGTESTGDTGITYDSVLKPTITYLLLRQEAFSIDGVPFSSHKELTPRLRESFNDPSCPQRVIEIYGQRMEMLVRFQCVHPRAETAYGLARWFKGFISRRTPSLEANGVGRILYHSQGDRPRRGGKTGDDAAVHDVVYYIQTEELSVREESAIRRLNLISRVSQRKYSDLGLTGVTEPGDEGYLQPYTGSIDESGNYLWGDTDIQDLRYTGSQDQ